jgi:hypothetical protein
MKMFLTAANQALGTELTKPVDLSGKQVSDAESFLSALVCFHDTSCTSKPLREVLANSPSVAGHLSYGFLFVVDKDTLILSMERTRLKHTVAVDLSGLQLAIVSGTLSEIHSAVIECCNPHATKNLRALYAQLLNDLEREGITFPSLRRSTHKDGTLLLEHRAT